MKAFKTIISFILIASLLAISINAADASDFSSEKTVISPEENTIHSRVVDYLSSNNATEIQIESIEEAETDAVEQEPKYAVTSQITVTGGKEGIDYTKSEDGTLTVMTSTPLILDGGGTFITTENIILGVSGENESEINVTFKNLCIKKTSEISPVKIPDDYSKAVNISLKGRNELEAGTSHAAIEKNGDASTGTLTIGGDGSLNAVGGRGAAGIGGSSQKKGSNIIISSGTVTATGGSDGAGIGGGSNGNGLSITILGGTITATGGASAAGIGGGDSGNGSDITISGGIVTAEGGSHGVGIGAGESGNRSSITISGGIVNAIGGSYAAGIGGNASNVSISGGTVTAIGENYGIEVYGNTIIRNASVKTETKRKGKAVSGDVFNQIDGDKLYPIAIPHYGELTISYKLHSAKTWDSVSFPDFHKSDNLFYFWLPEGKYDFKAGSHEWDSVSVHGNKVSVNTRRIIIDEIFGSRLEITSPDQYKVDDIIYDCSEATDNYCIEQVSTEPMQCKRIVITDVVELTIKNLNLQPIKDYAPILDLSKTNITITAKGTNTLYGASGCAGIEKPLETGTLTLVGDGSINARGGYHAAGIGGGDSRESREILNRKSDSNESILYDTEGIYLYGCTIAAKGGSDAAGIGGGNEGNGSNITISEGVVTASGAGFGAGIGGGYEGNGSNITISGGTVSAAGGSFGAGIGGGFYGNGSNITISGGTVTAAGYPASAGIGGGSNGDGYNITISGGTVTATGDYPSAGIGGGSDGDGYNITISGGTVKATGLSYAAGIGGGERGNGSNITISGGNVIAIGGTYATGIGGGKSGTTTGIFISGGNVKTTKMGVIPVQSSTNATPLFLNKISGYLSGDSIPFTSIEGADYYNLTDIVAYDDGCFYLYLPKGINLDSYSKCLVKFETNCDISVPNQSLFKGEKVSKPTGVVKEGYYLDGWYTSKNSRSETYRWDFSINTVTEDMTLYAGWTQGEGTDPDDPTEFLVKFETNCDISVPDQSLRKGDKVKEPTGVVREGYYLSGWYTDKYSRSDAYRWDFNTNTVTENMTLYAGWTQGEGVDPDDPTVPTDKCLVKFETNCDISVPDQLLLKGDKVTEPTDVVKEGYYLNGWYTDKSFRSDAYRWKFNIDTVTENMTLYAGWTQRGGVNPDDPSGSSSDGDASDPNKTLTPGDDGIYRYTLVLGEQYKVNIAGINSQSLSSYDNKIVAVNKKGIAQGKKVGSTTVNCTVSNKTKTIKFTVVYPVISAPTNYIVAGQKIPLSIKGTSISNVTWKVNNSKAYVSKDGVLTGNSSGNVKVTATIHNKSYSATFKVENPTFKKSMYIIKAGKKGTVKLTGTKQTMRISYSIEDENIAAITSDGKIAGLTPGITVLSATLGGKTYTTKIKVEN